VALLADRPKLIWATNPPMDRRTSPPRLERANRIARQVMREMSMPIAINDLHGLVVEHGERLPNDAEAELIGRAVAASIRQRLRDIPALAPLVDPVLVGDPQPQLSGASWKLPLSNPKFPDPVRVSLQPAADHGSGWTLRTEPSQANIGPGQSLAMRVFAEKSPRGVRYPLPELVLSVEVPGAGHGEPLKVQTRKALPLVGIQPPLSIPRADEAPSIDGDLSESAWDRPADVPLLGRMDQSREGILSTSVWLTAHEQGLSVAFRCEEPQPDRMRLNVEQRDGNAFLDDCVELMLAPEGQENAYYQFVVNAQGVLYDGKRFDGSFDAQGVKTAGRVGESGYRVEMMIPWQALGLDAPPSRAGLLLARTRYAGEQTEVFQFPISPKGNHQPSFFSRAEFEAGRE
jgi:hypothetical protein